MEVLIVEDDAGLTELVKEKLEECGFKTASVQSAGEALGWLKDHTPYLIILDYSLPDMNGKELIAEIQKTGRAIPPFIVSTGQGDEHIAVDMMKLGAKDYLVKDRYFLYKFPEVLKRINNEIENDNKLRHAEEELRKLSRAVEQSPVIVVITNTAGDIEYVNTRFCRGTGYSKEEVIGKNPRILKSGHQDSKFYKELWSTILKGGEWEGEFYNKKKNGELYWESALISPLTNKQGEITHFVAAKEDITEKKKMIGELINAKEKAEEMSHLKSSFLANMSHELRTPLNGILGYASILALDLNNPEQIEMAQGIFRSGKRLTETLNFILDLSAAEADKMELTAKDIAVVPLTRKSIDSFSAEAAKKNIQLEMVIKDENIYAFLDEHLFMRVLYNLIDNAVKFTAEGKIIVELGKEINDEKDWLYIKVKDTGIGIAADKIDLIWEEFRQVSEGMSRRFEGPGLGLTISKKAVELMHGTVSVESEAGAGSVFTVKFPALKNAPQNEDAEQKRPAVAEPEKEISETRALPSILYVEDDPVNRSVVKLFLKNLCVFETAEDGETALQLASDNNYDLILMDINLGNGMNGMEVVKEIIKMPKYSDTPIIAVTAYAMEKDKTEFLNGGCTHYLSKPFSKAEIIDLVTSAI